jgi:hypothetical protein
MKIKRLPAGFVIPAQPVLASNPPVGADWVHEIKHDGYRMIVRRDGPTVRLYSRNTYDNNPLTHRTRTVDYAIVMSGEIDLVLDDTTIHLKAGDVVVQQAIGGRPRAGTLAPTIGIRVGSSRRHRGSRSERPHDGTAHQTVTNRQATRSSSSPRSGRLRKRRGSCRRRRAR